MTQKKESVDPPQSKQNKELLEALNKVKELFPDQYIVIVTSLGMERNGSITINYAHAAPFKQLSNFVVSMKMVESMFQGLKKDIERNQLKLKQIN